MPFTYPPAVCEASNLSLSPTLVVVCLFHHSQPSGCEGCLTVVWTCASLMTNDAEHFFFNVLNG